MLSSSKSEVAPNFGLKNEILLFDRATLIDAIHSIQTKLLEQELDEDLSHSLDALVVKHENKYFGILAASEKYTNSEVYSCCYVVDPFSVCDEVNISSNNCTFEKPEQDTWDFIGNPPNADQYKVITSFLIALQSEFIILGYPKKHVLDISFPEVLKRFTENIKATVSTETKPEDEMLRESLQKLVPYLGKRQAKTEIEMKSEKQMREYIKFVFAQQSYNAEYLMETYENNFKKMFIENWDQLLYFTKEELMQLGIALGHLRIFQLAFQLRLKFIQKFKLQQMASQYKIPHYNEEKLMKDQRWRAARQNASLIRKHVVDIIRCLNFGLVELEEPVKLSLLALFSREHILLLGPPGVGKSMIALRIVKLLGVDEKVFSLLMTRFTSPEEVFGPLSVTGLKQDELKRNTEHYLPTAKIAFLDEIFKSNSAILNSLLTVLNERTYFNDSLNVCIPLLLLIGASNEGPSMKRSSMGGIRKQHKTKIRKVSVVNNSNVQLRQQQLLQKSLQNNNTQNTTTLIKKNVKDMTSSELMQYIKEAKDNTVLRIDDEQFKVIYTFFIQEEIDGEVFLALKSNSMINSGGFSFGLAQKVKTFIKHLKRK
ncbi:hypothetical protein ABK040_012174 [Willaertia magna]